MGSPTNADIALQIAFDDYVSAVSVEIQAMPLSEVMRLSADDWDEGVGLWEPIEDMDSVDVRDSIWSLAGAIEFALNAVSEIK